MKNIAAIQLIILLLFIFTDTNAQKARGNYNVIEIPAPSLKNNLIGDDTIQKIGIYLPPSYNSSKKSYPVVYFLHGHSTKVQESDAGKLEMMENNTAQELIYVEISGYNLYHGSWYVNSYVTGNWEDYVTHDVISYVDNHYRTIPDRKSRGLVGASMGGQGTFNISLKHPDKFSAIHLMSPGVGKDDKLYNFLFPNDSSVITLKNLIDKLKDIPERDYEYDLTRIMNETGDFWIHIGAGVAYSPDSLQPLFMAPLFDFDENGNFKRNESVWALWLEYLEVSTEKIKMYKDNLMTYSYYGMDVGYNDQLAFILDGVKRLSDYLWEQSIPHSVFYSDRDHLSGYDIVLENRVMPLMSIYLKGE